MDMTYTKTPPDAGLDRFRDAQALELVAVPRWMLHHAVYCALYTTRNNPPGDGGDILQQMADELLERAPCDVDDLTASFDGTGKYARDDDEDE